MSKMYHLPFSNDNVAHNTRMQLRDSVRAAGGDTYVAPSFGHGTAFVVATLPDDVDPTTIFGELEHHEVEEKPFFEVAAQLDAIIAEGEKTGDKPEEGAGDGAGEPDGQESPSEGTESEEAAPLGSDQGSAE